MLNKYIIYIPLALRDQHLKNNIKQYTRIYTRDDCSARQKMHVYVCVYMITNYDYKKLYKIIKTVVDKDF